MPQKTAMQKLDTVRAQIDHLLSPAGRADKTLDDETWVRRVERLGRAEVRLLDEAARTERAGEGDPARWLSHTTGRNTTTR